MLLFPSDPPPTHPVLELAFPELITRHAETEHGRATAVFSSDERYRYLLTRAWGTGPSLGFVLLNPSTADEFALDPTLTRCWKLALREGAGSMVVLNAFAYRATDPRVMRSQPDPVGPDNDRVILAVAKRLDTLVLGWGTHGVFRDRDAHLRRLLGGLPTFQLGPPTKDGHPRHPLYLRSDVELRPA